MIYLIGGAPRVGKSIVAKNLAEANHCTLISTDDLCSAFSKQLPEEERRVKFPFPGFSGNPSKNTLTPKELIDLQVRSVTSLEREVDRHILDALSKDESLVLEGVHLLPNHIKALMNEHGSEHFQTIFIGSKSIDQIIEGVIKNTNTGNWLRESSPVVIRQVAEFIAAFSEYIGTECARNNLPYYERTENFEVDKEKLVQQFPSIAESKLSIK